MTAETIPAKVLALADRLRGMFDMAIPSEDAFNRLSPAGFRLLREAHDMLMADRSTRPAEPATEIEVGGGEVVAWQQAIPMEYGGGWKYAPFRVNLYSHSAAEPLVRLSTLEAERARAKAEADELRQKRDEALAEADDLRTRLAMAVDDLTTIDGHDGQWSKLVRSQVRAEAAETALSRALQDRDEAVRVAVEGHE